MRQSEREREAEQECRAMALVCHTGLACRAWGAQTRTRDGKGKEDRGRGSCKLVERFAHNAQAGQHNSRSITKKWTAMAAQTTTKQVAENSAESALLEALIGVQGRGRSASKQQLQVSQYLHFPNSLFCSLWRSSRQFCNKRSQDLYSRFLSFCQFSPLLHFFHFRKLQRRWAHLKQRAVYQTL